MSIKEQTVAAIVAEIESLPDDVDWQFLSQRVRLLAGVEKARADVRAGRVYSTAEIKTDISDEVNRLDDIDASWSDLAEHERFMAAIEEGRASLRRGEGIPHEDVKREVLSWFQK